MREDAGYTELLAGWLLRSRESTRLISLISLIGLLGLIGPISLISHKGLIGPMGYLKSCFLVLW